MAIDPNYAPAKAAIGWFRVHEDSHGRNPVSEADAAEAVALAKEVLEAGKDDPDALWMAAYTLIFSAGERDIAAAAIDRALNSTQMQPLPGELACLCFVSAASRMQRSKPASARCG